MTQPGQLRISCRLVNADAGGGLRCYLDDMATYTDEQVRGAVARLDADIATAERRVTEVENHRVAALWELDQARERRRGADAFLAYLGAEAETLLSVPAIAPNGSGLNAVLVDIIERAEPGTVFSLDGTLAIPQVAELRVTREQVRNGMHYLRRNGRLVTAGRGLWTPTNAEAPAAAGASETEGSNSDPSQLEGAPDDSPGNFPGRSPLVLEAPPGHGQASGAATIGGGPLG